MLSNASPEGTAAGGFTPSGAPLFSPRTNTWVYRLLFHQMGAFVSTGYARTLETGDFFPSQGLETQVLVEQFERDWAEQLAQPDGPSLWKALSKGTAPVFYVTGVLHFIGVGCQFASPLLLQQILAGISSGASKASVLVYVGYLAMVNVCYSIAFSHERILLATLALRMRNKLMTAVYRKTLRLSSGAMEKESSGRIVTLLSNDCQKLQDFFPQIHEVWASPLLVGASLWLLYQVLSWAAFVGLAVIVFSTVLTGKIGGKLFGFRKQLVALADKRINLLSEVLGSMKTIKLYAFERQFQKRVTAIRDKEVGLLWIVSKISALFGLLLFTTPVVIGVVSIGSFSLAGNDLTATRVYTALAAFNVLRFPLIFLPFIIISGLNAKVALDRLTEFLTAGETEPLGELDLSEPGRIVLTDCEFTFSKPLVISPPPGGPPGGAKPASKPADKAPVAGATQPPESLASAAVELAPAPRFRLTNASFSIPPGSLTMVIGPVGSGKSALLLALNRYLVREQGTVTISGRIGFVAQTAWILNATVEANITFGAPKDEARYAAAVKAAQLGPDLLLLPFGHATEIGERGVTLSGGQKQRVSIARLLYAAPDIALLDDPLSALDAHVGAQLFKECIQGELRKKTRVLVTNALEYLPQADLVIVMDGGRVREVGSYAELRAKGTDFDELMETHAINGRTSMDGRKPSVDGRKPSVDGRKASVDGRKASVDGRKGDEGAKAEAVKKEEPSGSPAGNLTGTEKRSEGKVTAEVYLFYGRSMGNRYMGGLAAVLSVSMLFSIEYGVNAMYSTFVGWWAADKFRWNTQGDARWYLAVFAAIGIVNAVFTYARSLSFYVTARNASQRMHQNLLAKVMRLPMAFFDATPTGRIINRFSKDTETLDSLLPLVLMQTFACFWQILASFIIIAIASLWFLVGLCVIVPAYYFTQRYYIPAAIEAQRLEAITRSPIYSSIAEAVPGVATIRAYRTGAGFMATIDAQVFLNSRAQLTQRMAAEWLNVRLRLIGTTIAALAALLVIQGAVSPGLAGLTLTYAVSVTSFLEQGTAQASDAEGKMNSVERMKEYEAEAEEAVYDTPPAVAAALPPQWPRSGALSVEKLRLRYRPGLPPVLQDVSFSIASGQKVGIVGRTGSGKSSLLLALFRIVEAEAGRILLDGVDTATLGLAQLRGAMGMLPQDPLVFQGSIRSNLDIFDEHSDAALWEALGRVGLRTFVEASPLGLSADVTDGGGNLSQGQRQLMCMARALLRSCPVLCLDEATASIDLDSDALIQKTVRECFQNVTVLTIAHRLNTVIDSDLIIVLDAGAVVECGPPNDLLQQAGPFSRLVDGTGQHNAAHLRRLAAAAASGARLAAADLADAE